MSKFSDDLIKTCNSMLRNTTNVTKKEEIKDCIYWVKDNKDDLNKNIISDKKIEYIGIYREKPTEYIEDYTLLSDNSLLSNEYNELDELIDRERSTTLQMRNIILGSGELNNG